jgi:hypothetical protein
VRHAGEAHRAEQPGQALQRVDRAEDVVDQVRIGRALLQGIVQREDVAAETFDDLLGLGEELLPRAVDDVAHPVRGADRSPGRRLRTT